MTITLTQEQKELLDSKLAESIAANESFLAAIADYPATREQLETTILGENKALMVIKDSLWG